MFSNRSVYLFFPERWSASLTSSHRIPHWKKFTTLWVDGHKPRSSCRSCRSLLTPCVRVCACTEHSSKDVCGQDYSRLFWYFLTIEMGSCYLHCLGPLHVPNCGSLFCFFVYLYIPSHLLFVSTSSLLSSYLVMPLVAQDLSHIMKRRRLTVRIITYLFYQLLRGLKVSVDDFFLLKIILHDVIYIHTCLHLLLIHLRCLKFTIKLEKELLKGHYYSQKTKSQAVEISVEDKVLGTDEVCTVNNAGW